MSIHKCWIAIMLIGATAVARGVDLTADNAARQHLQGDLRRKLLEGTSQLSSSLARKAVKEKAEAIKESAHTEAKSYAEHEAYDAILEAATTEATIAVDNGTYVTQPVVIGRRSFIRTVHITKTSDPDGFTKAATVNYEASSGKEVYSLQAAVVLDLPEFKAQDLFAASQFGLDLDLSSDKAKNPGKVAARFASTLGSIKGDETPTLLIPQVILTANRNLKPKTLVGEILALPGFSVGKLKLNAVVPIGDLGRVQVRPLVGLDVGSVLSRPAKLSPESGGFTRIVAKLHLQIEPKAYKDLVFFVDETAKYLGDDDNHPYNLLEFSFEYKIAKQWTFTVTQSIGRDEPYFEMNREFKAGIGFKL